MSLRSWINTHPRHARRAAIEVVAAACGVTPVAVAHWAAGVRGLPPRQCPSIEAATGVPCEQLLPDLRWQRDADGRVIAYAVPLQPIETGKAAALAGVE